MNILLYIILLLLPLPLFIFLINRKHYIVCLLPFMALLGIYGFNIIGSIEVIRNERLFSWLYYFSLIIIIVLFYFFYLIIFSFKSKLNINWTTIPKSNIITFLPLLTILWAYSFLMFYLYYERHGLPALFHISLFQYTNIYALRAKGSTSLPEGGHWYWFAFSTIPSFIFVFTYIIKRLNPTIRTKAYFYLNTLLVLFFSSLYLLKTPYVYLILYILIVNFLIRGKPIKIKKLFGYIVLAIGAIITMLRLYLLDRGFIDVLKIVPTYLFDRICVDYTRAHAYIIQIFPDQHDFFYGTAFSNPGHIFPYEPINLSQFLGNWISRRVENYSSPSFSQGYANFGFLGFILIILTMFFQILLLQVVFKKCPKNPLFLSLYVLVMPCMLGYGNTGIQNIISEIFVLFSIACIFAYYSSRNVTRILGQSVESLNLASPLSK